MSTIKEVMLKISKIDKVTGAILSSYEGIIIDSMMREGKDEVLQAGIASHKLTKAKESLSRLNLGEIKQMNLYGANGSQCLFEFNGKFLVVNCNKDANINYVSLELQPLIEDINKILTK